MFTKQTSLVMVHPFGLDESARPYIAAHGRNYMQSLRAEIAAAQDVWVASPRVSINKTISRINRLEARVAYTYDDGHQLTRQSYDYLVTLMRPQVRIVGGFLFYNNELTGCAGEFAKSLARKGTQVTIVASACFTDPTYKPPKRIFGPLSDRGYLSLITVTR